MSRKILALPLLAALALVGCDDSSSSTKTTTGGGTTGTCDGYKGTWVFDSTMTEEGFTYGSKIDLKITTTNIDAKITATMGDQTFPVGSLAGTYREIPGSKLVVTPTSVMELDEENNLVPSTDPSDLDPDTLVYAFPAPGKLTLENPNDEDDDGVEIYTCK